MCQAIQEMRLEERRLGKKEGERIGREEGQEIQARETSKRLYAMGLDIGAIAPAVGRTAETVRGWLGLTDDLSNR